MIDSNSSMEGLVTQFLEHLGYPRSSIIYEPLLLPTAAGINYRPDIGILDPSAKEYVAVIEVKSKNDSVTVVTGSDQLRKYVNALRPLPVQGFLAVPDGAGKVSFYQLAGDGAVTLMNAAEFPTYEHLRSVSSTSTRSAVRAGIKDTTDKFRVVSWSVAFAAIVLAAADFVLKEYRGVVLLSAERLALLGVAAALLLVPYAAKLKAFGLEFERVAPRDTDRDSVA